MGHLKWGKRKWTLRTKSVISRFIIIKHNYWIQIIVQRKFHKTKIKNFKFLKYIFQRISTKFQEKKNAKLNYIPLENRIEFSITFCL